MEGQTQGQMNWSDFIGPLLQRWRFGRASEFYKEYGDKGKGSGVWKFHGLLAIRGPTIVLAREEFLILKSLDDWKMHSWACGLPPYINANMDDIRSFFCNLKEQNYLVLLFHRTKST